MKVNTAAQVKYSFLRRFDKGGEVDQWNRKLDCKCKGKLKGRCSACLFSKLLCHYFACLPGSSRNYPVDQYALCVWRHPYFAIGSRKFFFQQELDIGSEQR